MTCVRPETSPAPFRTKPPAITRSTKMSSRGMIAVTPVRTGPLPGSSGPSPSISVVWPTRTPAHVGDGVERPGGMVPSESPRSRKRAALRPWPPPCGQTSAHRGFQPVAVGVAVAVLGGRRRRASLAASCCCWRPGAPRRGLLLLALLLAQALAGPRRGSRRSACGSSMPAALAMRHEVGVVRRQARQRVDLDDVDLALRRSCADRRAPRRGSRARGRSRARRARRACSSDGVSMRRAVVVDVLLPLLLDVEVVDRPRLRLVLEQDLHRRQHARAGGRPAGRP